MDREKRVESYWADETYKDKNYKNDAVLHLINEKYDAERLLRKLVPKLLGVYVLDSVDGSFRDIIGSDYFREIVKIKKGNYAQSMLLYRDKFVDSECYGIIDYVLDYEKVYKVLNTGENLKFSYYKKDGELVSLQIKPYSDRKEDAHLSIWIFMEETTDDIDKERERQKEMSDVLAVAKQSDDELKKALYISEIKDEIIAAMGKVYQYISRIDIDADYYEEITGLEDFHTQEGNKTGRPGDNARRMCEKRVAEEYREDFLKFTDMSTIKERMQDEETIEFEYRIKDGNWNRMCFVVKKRDENGSTTHVLCLVRNISEAKKKEQDLRLNALQARKEAAQKSRFLSDMSHDIRTPMNGIIGMLDLAEHHPSDLETQEYCRSKIRETSTYLLSLVNDVLDMNKLESDVAEIPMMNFDLIYMLRTCNEKAARKAAKRNIDYVIKWDETSYEHQYLMGNPIYTCRILEIIADNAVKFSKDGGSVEVWCKEEKLDEEYSIFEFGCRDYGIGMSEEFVCRAFDMFSQENMSGRTRYEGTGLGLALAKKMAERIDATIEIQSEKNNGTTVFTRIPFKIGHPDESHEILDFENMSVAGLRVLLVEDNDLNVEIAKFILENNDMKVECAYDGKEAVSKFENSEPGYYDVIIMDILMPQMNGWDATRKIRLLAREDAKNVPIIAMSANSFSEDIINSRLVGMDLHISKPIDNDKLIEAVKRSLRCHKHLMKNGALMNTQVNK